MVVNTGVFGLCRLLGSHLDQILIVVDLIFSVPILVSQSVWSLFCVCLFVAPSDFWDIILVMLEQGTRLFSVTVLVTCFGLNFSASGLFLELLIFLYISPSRQLGFPVRGSHFPCLGLGTPLGNFTFVTVICN